VANFQEKKKGFFCDVFFGFGRAKQIESILCAPFGIQKKKTPNLSI